MIITDSNLLKDLLKVVGLIMGFIFLVSVSIFHILQNYSTSCNCKYSSSFFILSLASLGVFVGILTYYVISKNFVLEKRTILSDVEKTLNFLERDERNIIKALIKNKGEIYQNKLSNITKLTPVKLHRKLSNLEIKKIIFKEKKGMTNKVYLTQEYVSIFVK